MKKIYFLLAAAIMFAGCAKDNTVTPEPPAPEGSKTTISASTGGTQTRVAFEDQDIDGIKMTWEEGDCFTLYDAEGNRVASFGLREGHSGTETGMFEQIEEGELLTLGEVYTAVYPACMAPTLAHRAKVIEVTTQQGNGSMEHIDDVCYMSASYTHNQGNGISFTLEYVLMTIRIEVPIGYNQEVHGLPSSLTFFDGVKSYFLNIVSGYIDGGLLTYMKVHPSQAESRMLRFDLLCGEYLFTKEIPSSKLYEAGKRYTATLGGQYALELAETEWKFIDFSQENYPAGNIWVVTDADHIFMNEENNFMMGFRDALMAADGNGQRIRLILPNATMLGNDLFSNSIALESVSLPKVTFIENSAFSSCINLQSVSMPVAETIAERAFADCMALTDISLPAALSIGYSAFMNCQALKNVSLPNATIIDGDVFYGCGALESVSFPAATAIGGGTFTDCPMLKTVSLPAAVTIGSGAFSGCTGLESISLPSATLIDPSTFNGCIKLVSFSAPNATTIGSNAFSYCSVLESVYLPAVTELGNSAFEYCEALKTLSLPSLTAIPEGYYYESTFKGALFESISLPSVETVGNYAFQNCANLKSVHLPVVTTIGMSAFYDCQALESIAIPLVTEIGEQAFYNCLLLSNIDLPGLLEIGNNAFMYCEALASVSLPEVKTIGEAAFYHCSGIENISLPVVQTIKYGAFSECYALNTLSLATAPGAQAISVEENILNGVAPWDIDLTLGSAEYDAGVSDIEGKVWRGYEGFKSITKVD
ncbi:leucine-rich repeat protein [uncultured Alistipes sp.]|jgi:hypothetical protein|uniref:leucine-rich repeat domain-containing protein n=1 Tax=uncultured Alistipes sp. TaxID=538949 RepID=UPI0025E7DBD8|nr:leucine-rich repeat protein [uncultured Alistipes sp.]